MHASTPLILRKSRMRRRARTDLCGGRSVMVVPTATVILILDLPLLPACRPSGSYRAVARIVFPLSRFSPVSDGAQPHAADQRASWIDHPPIESKAAAS